MTAIALSILSLLDPTTASAQQQRRPNASAAFQSSIELIAPNVSLPKNVPAPQGQLTLFADFATAGPDGVPLYLVNRTTSPVHFNDLTIMLEYSRKGTWERAQAQAPIECAVIGRDPVLPPGQFFRSFGYGARQGTRERIRFSNYGDVSVASNEGEGLIDPADVAYALGDIITERQIPRTIVEILDQGPKGFWGQKDSPSTRVAALRLLQTMADFPSSKQAAAAYAQKLAIIPDPSPEERQAVEAIREILAGSWPERPAPAALFERCRRALEIGAVPLSNGFGLPENEPALIWSALADLAKLEFGEPFYGISGSATADPNRWLPITEKIAAAIQTKDGQATRAIATILFRDHLVDEILPDGFFEKAVLLGDRRICGAGAQVLSRRERWERLAELGNKLPADRRVNAFAALARSTPVRPGVEAFRNPDSPRQVEFWLSCMKHSPLEATWSLRSIDDSEHNPFDNNTHDPLRAFLISEAETSERQGEDFELGENAYMLEGAVEFLATWELDEDREVFRRLLTHRGLKFGNMPVLVGPPAPEYPIRKAASDALAALDAKKRGNPYLIRSSVPLGAIPGL